MREKELFLGRQKRFRGSNDRAQRRCHLKTDQDKDEAPDSEMTFAPRAKKTARRVDQTQAETDADHPKEQVQRAHESDWVSWLRKNPRHRCKTDQQNRTQTNGREKRAAKTA